MLWILSLLALPAITMQQCLTPDDTKLFDQRLSSQNTLFKGQQQFSLDLLRTVNSIKPTENVFFSPFSVYNAMLLSYFISANHTEAAIKKALYLDDSQNKLSVLQAHKGEMYLQSMRRKALNGSTSYDLSNANRLFVSPSLEIRQCMQDIFKDEVTLTDFAKDPSLATDTINNWVSNQTKNNIKDLLKAGDLTHATQIVLANAAYFKGIWKLRFQPEATRKDIFYISNSQNAFVTMMRQKSTFNHLVSERLGAHVLELPYKGDAISFYIFLPPFASPNGISNILKRMDIEAFQEVLEQNSPRQVDVSIPKFTIEQELDMVQVLEKLGIGDLFKPTADLSSLTGEPGLTLDKAVHKAKVKVDEEGTTAAAATAEFNFRSSRPVEPIRFICNHPFLYLLYDKVSKTILFSGVFNRPPEST